MNTLNLSRLTLAITATLATTTAFAAGLDRSGQNTTAFFQDGLYAEAVYTYIDGDVTGYDNANGPSANYAKGNKLNNIIETYDFFRFGVKDDINDKWSVGVLYDEPWGAAVKYSGDNNFVTNEDTLYPILSQGKLESAQAAKDGLNQINAGIGKIDAGISQIDSGIGQIDAGISKIDAGIAQAQSAGLTDQVNALNQQKSGLETKKSGLETQKSALETQKSALETKKSGIEKVQGLVANESDAIGEKTNVEVRTNSLTGIVGYKFGENNNFQVYGGPVLQRLHADISLRGSSYSGLTGYDMHISPESDLGWLAGVAYYKPEIALKAALTYRSEIDHKNSVDEVVPVGDIKVAAKELKYKNDNGSIDITTPASVNFDFQTGLNQTTLLTANVRYVPWSDFSITPPNYNTTSTLKPEFKEKGLPIVAYDDDQWKVDLGLAKRLNDKLAVSGNVGWDSGAGNPTTSLGPVEGYYSAGLGAKYNITDSWAVSAGGKYLWFGDADAMVPSRDLVGRFEDNDGFVAGIKLSYQEK
ncbi:outer membrane protein transport protein [Psychrobacter sp. HD31]|uniref:outer membrane protein transport protein n=1 Tax=Psychrobacter sp. HD31 TaxID=3112003 RepID=UPI003DA5212B